MIKGLSTTGYGINPSKLLASMAAGFLGGKGPAASLAGGFGGMAKSQGEDISELAQLAKTAMIYGPLQQAKLEQTKAATDKTKIDAENDKQKIVQQNKQFATNLASKGKVPIGQAYRLYGVPPEPGQTHDQMDDEWMKTQPLPAGPQKTVTTHVEDIGKLSKLQQQFVTTAKQLENGEFHVDLASQAKYKAILADPTGLASKMFGQDDVNAAQKWNSFIQTQALAREAVANAQKGALSDARSKSAMEAIVGGYGSMNDQALAAHLNLLA
jgi:hypothetical protein